MDYKKEYEKKLSEAKRLHKVAVETNNYNTRMTLEELYPELIESEDERTRREIIAFIKWAEDRGSMRDDWHQKKLPEKWINWLKNHYELYNNTEWSQEDEEKLVKIGDCLNAYGNISTDERAREIFQLADWLKALKPQPKQGWSEEDAKMLRDIISCLRGQIDSDPSMVRWLKCLEPTATWKPSKEQMEYLSQAADRNDYTGHVLTTLYQDLKKL